MNFKVKVQSKFSLCQWGYGIGKRNGAPRWRQRWIWWQRWRRWLVNRYRSIKSVACLALKNRFNSKLFLWNCLARFTYCKSDRHPRWVSGQAGRWLGRHNGSINTTWYGYARHKGKELFRGETLRRVFVVGIGINNRTKEVEEKKIIFSCKRIRKA